MLITQINVSDYTIYERWAHLQCISQRMFSEHFTQTPINISPTSAWIEWLFSIFILTLKFTQQLKLLRIGEIERKTWCYFNWRNISWVVAKQVWMAKFKKKQQTNSREGMPRAEWKARKWRKFRIELMTSFKSFLFCLRWTGIYTIYAHTHTHTTINHVHACNQLNWRRHEGHARDIKCRK